MRIYYIFSIKEDVYKITKNSPEKVYSLLESIYKLKKGDINLGYKLFEKSCNFLEKKNINNLIKIIYSNNLSYTSYRNKHIFNDYYKNENTEITINSSHIILKTNVSFPIFFNEIKNINNSFVCDFINEDYFFLKSIFYNNKVKTK